MRLWRDTGRCIMGAMRAQRRRDLVRLCWSITDPDERSRFLAWLWWGWSPWSRVGPLGVSGWTYPYGVEPSWSTAATRPRPRRRAKVRGTPPTP